MSKKRILQIALVFFVAVFLRRSAARLARFTDCGSEVGRITAVDISPCSTTPCVLKTGTTVTGTVTFTPNELVKSGDVEAWVVYFGQTIPFPLSGGSNICEGFKMACPLRRDSPAKFVFSKYLDTEGMTLNISFKVQAKEQNGKRLFCFVVPLIIRK